MVFEPALTNNDWLGMAALASLLVVLVIAGGFLLRSVRRKSLVLVVAVVGLCSVAGIGVAKLMSDRLHSMCSIEFTDQEAIVHGVAGTVRLPLSEPVQVDLGVNSVRLVSGGESAVLPESAQWEIGNLTVDADYLANEFVGRAK